MSIGKDTTPESSGNSDYRCDSPRLEDFPVPPGVFDFPPISSCLPDRNPASPPSPAHSSDSETLVGSPTSEKSTYLPLYPAAYSCVPSTPHIDEQVALFHKQLNKLVHHYVQDLRRSSVRKRTQVGETFAGGVSVLIEKYENAVGDEGWKYIGERIVRDAGFRASKYKRRDADVGHVVMREIVRDLNAVFEEQRRREMEGIKRLHGRVEEMIAEAERRYEALEALQMGEGRVFEKRRAEWVEEMEGWILGMMDEFGELSNME